MPNPNNLAPKVATTVVIVTGAASVEGFSAPNLASAFTASPSFPTRIKGYTGDIAEKDALLAADGFAVDSPPRRQIRAAMLQDGPPATIYIGRKDAADADWGVTMDAISAENDDDWYAFAIDARDSASIQQADVWVSPAGADDKFAFFVAQTDSAQVLAGSPGSFDQVIAARGRNRTALLWHDPATSSGLAPATISTRTGPFVFGASETLEFRFDGGATQSYVFPSTAAFLLGSQTETFDLSAGGILTLAANALPAQDVDLDSASAVLTSANVGPFLGLADSDTVLVRVDGGAAVAATINAAAAVLTSPNAEPFAPVLAEQLDLKINGGVSQGFTFDGTEVTAQLTADMLNLTAIGFVASDVAGAVVITTDAQGTAASIEIEATTSANILVEYGWLVATTPGTGDVADITSVSAVEIANVITTDIAGAAAADVGGAVVITATSIGLGSALQVTGGNINTATAFPTTQVNGSGFIDANAVGAAEVVALINASVGGLVAGVSAGAVTLTSSQLGSGSSVTVSASASATTLGLAAGTVLGAGPFADAAQATAAELQIEINTAGIVGGTAQEVSSALQLASATTGSGSSVQIITDTVGLSWTGDGFALGTGTDEDYADCAWIGRCITFDLDGTNGVSIWDNQNLTGIAADKLDLAQRTSLFQRRVNSYVELRRGRPQTFGGLILRKNDPDDYLYIDELTTADWLDARYTEDQDDALNSYADAKTKIDFGDGPGGFGVLENAGRGTLKRADRNGHTTYDGSPLDLLDPQSTGVFFPRFADMSEEDINLRRYANVRIRQNFKSATQRSSSLIELQRPPVQL